MALAGRQSELAALDGALDRCTRGLGALQRDLGVALLFISHDLGVIRQVSDRIAVMKDGRIIETGDTDQVFASPRAEYTRELLEAVPRLDAGAGEVVRTAIPVRRSSP
jgi:peptide/nickel transport system ATP-binding protein